MEREDGRSDHVSEGIGDVDACTKNQIKSVKQVELGLPDCSAIRTDHLFFMRSWGT